MLAKVSKANGKLHAAGNMDGAHDTDRQLLNGKHRAHDSEILMVSQEILRLVDASREGRLSDRGNEAQFKRNLSRDDSGRKRHAGRNPLLPIGEGNRVLAQISAGKIDELIVQTYKGDHEKMKLAVNNVALVTQGLQQEMARLTEASKEGQLSERGKPQQFQGAFADMVRGRA